MFITLSNSIKLFCYRLYNKSPLGALGSKTREFSKNFGLLALAEAISMVIGFPVKIMVGRFLGPVEYGKFSLIVNLAMFLIIPMLFSLSTAAQKYIPENRKNEKLYLGQIITIFIVFFFASTALLVALSQYIQPFFQVDVDIYYWSLIYAAVMCLYAFFESVMRSINSYKIIFIASILNSVALLGYFLFAIIVLNDKTYRNFTVANLIYMLLPFVIYAVFLLARKVKLFTWHKKIVSEIIHYSSYGIVGSLTGFAIQNADRFFLNSYTSIYWVGIYSAYVNGSAFIFGRFFQHFLNVYFPTISGEKDKNMVFNKINKILKIAFLPVFAFSFLSILFVVWVFGKEFPLNFWLIALFSLANCLYMVYQLYMWLLNSEGIRGARTVQFFLVVGAAINLGLLFLLVPAFGIFGAVYTTLLLSLFLSVAYFFSAKKFIANRVFDEKQKQKICFINFDAYPLFNKLCSKTFGGAEVQLYLLAKELAKTGECEISFATGDFGQPVLEKYGEIKVYKARFDKTTKYWPKNKLWRLYLFLFKIKADVYVFRSASVETGISCLIAKLLGKKFVYMVAHDNECNRIYEKQNGPKFARNFIYGLRHADFVIAQNEEQKANLSTNYGIKSEIINSSYEITWADDDEKKDIIIWVARCEDWKRPEIFLQLAKANPKENFVMIAPRSDNQPELFPKIKESALRQKNVQFIEKVPFEEIDEYFKRAKLFVQTSTFEGFPNTFIQAAKNKTPIFSLKVNPDDFLGRSGSGYCADDNLEKFFRKFQDMIRDKKNLKKMAEQGFNYVSKYHDVKKNAKIFCKHLFK